MKNPKLWYWTLVHVDIKNSARIALRSGVTARELDRRSAKSFGGKSKRVVLPLFITNDGHFPDMLSLLHHETHVAPISAPLPPFECLENNESVPPSPLVQWPFWQSGSADHDRPSLKVPRSFSCNSFRNIDYLDRHCLPPVMFPWQRVTCATNRREDICSL